MTLSGFMPNAAATSLGSIVLTRSARRVQRMTGGDAAAVEEVLDIGGRGRRPPSLSALGDDHVRVGGVLGLAVGEAALQGPPARRVEGHRAGTAAESVVLAVWSVSLDAQVPDLVTGSAVEQREDPQQCLVRMASRPLSSGGTVRAARPGKGLAGEPAGFAGGQVPGAGRRG